MDFSNILLTSRSEGALDAGLRPIAAEVQIDALGTGRLVVGTRDSITQLQRSIRRQSIVQREHRAFVLGMRDTHAATSRQRVAVCT